MGEFIASRLSLGQAHTAAARLLREARIAAPELDARLLLCHAAGLTHEAYVAGINDALAPDAAARFGAYVARRLAGEPVSRIVGIREFYGRPFRIDASTLDPRPDTETLIEAALALAGGERPLKAPRPRHGERAASSSRCWPNCRGRAVSASTRAWRRLSSRAPTRKALGSGTGRASSPAIGWRPSKTLSISWSPTRPISRRQTWPGSPTRSAPTTPRDALYGGPDGLSAYRRIVPRLLKVLRPGGIALFEIGHTQAEAVSGLLAEAGLILEQGPWRDLAGRPRVVGGRARG